MDNIQAADLISRNKSVFQHDPEMLEALDKAIIALSIIGADEEYFPGRRAFFNGYAEGAKRPQGKWVGLGAYLRHMEEMTGDQYSATPYYNGALYCNHCWKSGGIHKTNFCPHCGSYNGDGNETDN